MHWQTFDELSAIHNEHVHRAMLGMRAMANKAFATLHQINERVDGMSL